jgi:YVTN family beta-propeller protein
MIRLLGMGGIGREQKGARLGRPWRVAAVLGMLAVPLAAAEVTAVPAAAATTYTVTATVRVGSEPFGVDVDSATHTIYVSTRQNNSVSVIDGATNTVTATVGVGSDPAGVGVDPATHTVYVTNDSSDTVSVITPPQPGPASVTATPRNTAAAVSWTAPAYLVNGATVTGYTATASPGGETCSTTGATSCTITGLTNDTTYSIAVIAHTTAGDSAAQTEGVNVVPWGATCPCTLWPSTAQPAVASASETSPVNLGVQFTSAVNGQITGIRFYKGPGNTGTHTGELWTASGTLLGKVTFTGESASGWQEADFSSPVAVTGGTTYVASYFAPNTGTPMTRRTLPARASPAGRWPRRSPRRSAAATACTTTAAPPRSPTPLTTPPTTGSTWYSHNPRFLSEQQARCRFTQVSGDRAVVSPVCILF